MRLRIIGILTVAMLVCMDQARGEIVSAMAFQDEGTTNIDVLAGVTILDDVWSPEDVAPNGTVIKNYYANGGSTSWFDAIALEFDRPSVQSENFLFKAYLQKGDYPIAESWQHYQLLPGLFNPHNEDAGSTPLGQVFPSDVTKHPGNILPNGETIGWVSFSIDVSSDPKYILPNGNIGLTLRLWNWRVDAVQLVDSHYINIPGDPIPMGLFQGETLNIRDDGLIGANFSAGHASKVNITGGSIGDNLLATSANVTISGGAIGNHVYTTGTDITISGGMIGNFLHVDDGSSVQVSGGTVGDFFLVHNSRLNMSGGTVGDQLMAIEGGIVNVIGGEIGERFSAWTGGTVNISSGLIGNEFAARRDSDVTFLGTEFLLNGNPIDGLNDIGDSRKWMGRGGAILGVTFRDGTRRDFVLSEEPIAGIDFFDAAANLRLTLANPWQDVDINSDGFSNRDDFDVLVKNFGTTENGIFAKGDLNGDGATTLADLIILQSNFGHMMPPPAANSAAVPEPSSFVLLLLTLASGGFSFLRRLSDAA